MKSVKTQADQEWLTQQVATLICSYKSLTEIAKDLNTSVAVVKKINELPETKELVRVRGEEIAMYAKYALRRGVSQMVTKALKVIEDQLDEGNLEAAKVVLKGLGALEAEPIQAQSSNITVVMSRPEGNQKVIEIDNEN